MAKKLRKMLGSIDSPECIGLMRLIETQSKETLAKWAVGYAQENYLPVYEKTGENGCYARAAEACKAFLAGETKLADVKPLLKEAREAAAKLIGRGIPVSCQSVLLKGVNDSAPKMIKLLKALSAARIRPYYVFMCDPVAGIGRFRVPVEKAREIERRAAESLGGLSLPRFVKPPIYSK